MALDYSLYLEIKDSLKKLAKDFKEDDFYSEDYKSDLIRSARNFSEELGSIRTALKIAKIANSIPEDVLISQSRKDLLSLKEIANGLYASFQAMQNFHRTPLGSLRAKTEEEKNQARQNFLGQKESLMSQFNEYHVKFSSLISPLMYWGVHSELTAAVAQIQTQNAASPHASIFEKYANDHENAAHFWLIGSLTMLGATVCYSHEWIYSEIEKVMNNIAHPSDGGIVPTGLFWGLIFIRITAIAAVGSFAFWGFHNYKINKHNEMLNRIKAASLRTFKDFSDATHDSKSTHDFVIRKIAETIFDSDRFGYLTKAENAQNISLSQISELLQVLKKD